MVETEERGTVMDSRVVTRGRILCAQQGHTSSPCLTFNPPSTALHN